MMDRIAMPDRREWDRKYRQTHKEQINKANRNYRITHPAFREHLMEYLKTWNRMHPQRNGDKTYRRPEQWRAYNVARKLPLEELCELCPDDEKQKATQRHHPDYSLPKIFVSCCASCHNFVDKGLTGRRMEMASEKYERRR